MNSKNPAVRLLVTALFWIAVAAIMFYVLFPFYWTLKTSFTSSARLSAEALQWFPSHLTWDNYRLVCSGQPFGRNHRRRAADGRREARCGGILVLFVDADDGRGGRV